MRNVDHTRSGHTARHLPAGVPHSLPIPIVMDRGCRLAVDCKLIKNYAEGTGKQPWVICSKTEDGDVLERKAKLESAGARIIESDDNGKRPLMSKYYEYKTDAFSQRCLGCCTRCTYWASGL